VSCDFSGFNKSNKVMPLIAVPHRSHLIMP
jgi:hypothetical protein